MQVACGLNSASIHSQATDNPRHAVLCINAQDPGSPLHAQQRLELTLAQSSTCMRSVESALQDVIEGRALPRRDMELEWEVPFRDLGFTGVPHRTASFVMPTVNCLVELIEQPFTVRARCSMWGTGRKQKVWSGNCTLKRKQ